MLVHTYYVTPEVRPQVRGRIMSRSRTAVGRQEGRCKGLVRGGLQKRHDLRGPPGVDIAAVFEFENVIETGALKP